MWIAYIFITLSAVIVTVSGFVLPLISIKHLNLNDVKITRVSDGVLIVNNKTIIKHPDGYWEEVKEVLKPDEWNAFKEYILSQK